MQGYRWNDDPDLAKRKIKSQYEYILKYCKKCKETIDKAQFNNKTIFREYSVRTAGPGSPNNIEKFTLQNPVMINKIDIIDQMIKEMKPDLDSLLESFEKISQVRNNLQLIRIILNRDQLYLENSFQYQDLPSPSKPKEYQKADPARRSKRQIARNINDSISLLQTVERYLKDYYDELYKIKPLCIKGLNNNTTDEERLHNIAKIAKFTDECERITEQGRFNTKTVFHDKNKPCREFSFIMNESRPSEYITFYSPHFINGTNMMGFDIMKKKYRFYASNIKDHIVKDKETAIKLLQKVLSNTERVKKNLSQQRAEIKALKERLEKKKAGIIKILKE